MASPIYTSTKDKMEKTISVLKEDLNTIRTGRANPKMLDKLQIDYYGAMTPVKQIATIASPEPRSLTIQPFDKSAMSAIEKAIQVSDLGLNPTNDGNLIRINIPALTEERRKELCKQAEKMGENAKIAIRNLRRDANDLIKKEEKASNLAEDEAKKELDDIQKLTDEHVKSIDSIIATKEKDIKEI